MMRMMISRDDGWPFIATEPLFVCCVGHVPPTNGRSTVWDENTLAGQCWETPATVPTGSSRLFVWGVYSCAWADDAWRVDVVVSSSGPKHPVYGHTLPPYDRHWRTPIFFGGTRQFFPSLQFSVLSLVGGFRRRWGTVILPWSTGFGLYFHLYLVQPPDLFFTGHFLFDAHHA